MWAASLLRLGYVGPSVCYLSGVVLSWQQTPMKEEVHALCLMAYALWSRSLRPKSKPLSYGLGLCGLCALFGLCGLVPLLRLVADALLATSATTSLLLLRALGALTVFFCQKWRYRCGITAGCEVSIDGAADPI